MTLDQVETNMKGPKLNMKVKTGPTDHDQSRYNTDRYKNQSMDRNDQYREQLRNRHDYYKTQSINMDDRYRDQSRYRYVFKY